MYQIGSKLGVNMLLYTHVGVYYGEGMVFHNHWKNGAEIIPLEQFCNGKKVDVLEQGVQNVNQFWMRVQQILASRTPYSFISNNCEHAVSYAREGVTASPQLAFYGAVGLITLGLGLVRYGK